MSYNKILEHPEHTVLSMADALEVHPERILLCTEDGRVDAHVKAKKWDIEIGSMEPHDECGALPVTADILKKQRGLIKITPSSVAEIRVTGKCDNPELEIVFAQYLMAKQKSIAVILNCMPV